MSVKIVSRTPDRRVAGLTKVTYATGTVVYRARVTWMEDGSQRELSQPFQADQYREAVAWLKETREQVGRGVKIASREHQGATVAEVVDEYNAANRARVPHALGAGTAANYANSLKAIVKVHGEVPVARLTAKMVNEVITTGVEQGITRANKGKRAAGPGRRWKAGTVNAFVIAMRLMLDYAVKVKYVPSNVARAGVERHRQDSRDKFVGDTFTVEELATVWATADADPMGIAFQLGLSGLRRGEIAGLRWTDIDQADQMMVIANARTPYEGFGVVEKEPKSRKARDYPLTNPALVAALRRHRTKQLEQRLAFGPEWTDSGYVVTNLAGEAFDPQTITKRWFAFLAENGFRRIRLHDARGTFATIMVATPGVAIAEVSAMLGHSRISFTMDTYVKTQPERVKAAAAAFGRLLPGGQ